MATDRVFGIRPIIEAIEAGKTIDKLMVQKDATGELLSELKGLAKAYEIPMQHVPIHKLNRLTGKNHQGAFAFLSPVTYYKIENLLPRIYDLGETPMFIILDRISDVRNFGAIARTAECTGVHGIVIPERGSASVTEDAIKTSAGALFNIPVCKEKSLIDTIEFLKLSGVKIVAASEKTDKLVYDIDFKGPVAIVMGSEENGVSHEIQRMSDDLAKLPIKGKIDSLNVSVACGAILYEALRQKL